MSKKITHEQARERKQNIITKQIALSSDIYSVRLIPISADETNIKEIQDFIDKQQKLLELYRELNNKILHTYNMFGRMTNKEWAKFANLEQKIKELENEIKEKELLK